MASNQTPNDGPGAEASPAHQPEIISITSGKGGVGKTVTTVNMAVAARKMGLRVLILDGDLGLANVDVVLGLTARHNIRDVLDGRVSLGDIVVEGPLGINVVPAGSGIASLTRLTYAQKQGLLDGIGSLHRGYDLLLIDTGAGISDTVIQFNQAANKPLVVTTPEPHAMTDAYALIKVLAEEYGINYFYLLVNQVRSEGEGLKIHERLADVAQRFLDVQVKYLGGVPADPQVPKSVMRRQAASDGSTFTLAGQAWTQIARQILGGAPGRPKPRGVQEFWRSLLWTEQRSGRGEILRA